MIQDVFIIGATGKVGRTLVSQINGKGDADQDAHANPTRIVGLASSKEFAFSQNGLPLTGGRIPNPTEYHGLGELLKAAECCKSNMVFVDATALNEPMTEFHLNVIQNTPYGIVTANKNPIALSDYPSFQKLTKNPRRYGYRCSVMAGAESVTFLQDLRDLNDGLHAVEGCFSGTNGYIATELEKGRRFSEILEEAKEKGYTEPDPRDDLSGLDVARKLIVLARTAGHKADIENVELSPFIPKEYFLDEDVERFMERTRELDLYFMEKMERAKSKEMSLRYVARIDVQDGAKIEVSLKEVPAKSPLGRLEGTSNKLVVVTDAYPEECPYSVEAPGAGLEVTARNIRRDLLYLLPERKSLLK